MQNFRFWICFNFYFSALVLCKLHYLRLKPNLFDLIFIEDNKHDGFRAELNDAITHLVNNLHETSNNIWMSTFCESNREGVGEQWKWLVVSRFLVIWHNSRIFFQLFYSFFKSLVGKDVVVELKNDLWYSNITWKAYDSIDPPFLFPAFAAPCILWTSISTLNSQTSVWRTQRSTRTCYPWKTALSAARLFVTFNCLAMRWIRNFYRTRLGKRLSSRLDKTLTYLYLALTECMIKCGFLFGSGEDYDFVQRRIVFERKNSNDWIINVLNWIPVLTHFWINELYWSSKEKTKVNVSSRKIYCNWYYIKARRVVLL